MRRIAIFEDKRGVLTLNSYDENKEKEFTIKGDKVYGFIKENSSFAVKDLLIGEKDGIPSLRIVTNKQNIDLINLEKLSKYEKYLSPFIDRVSKGLTDKKIQELKETRKKDSPPKVTRKNKHSKKVLRFATTAVALLIAGNMMSNIIKNHEIKGNASFNGYNIDKDSGIEIEEYFDNKIMPYEESDSIKVEKAIMKENEFTGEVINLNFEDRSHTEKAKYTKDTYGDLITKYSNRYGVDPDVMIAIATQERGVHSREMDTGGATGLMQIQNSVWVDHEISAYNYETGKVDTFTITEDSIKDLENNVMYGCMYKQNLDKYYNNNPFLAIQCYNMGYGNVNAVLDTYAQDKGLERDDIINNPSDIGWVSYLDLIEVGDNNYINNVLSWYGNGRTLATVNANNENISFKITNNDKQLKTF